TSLEKFPQLALEGAPSAGSAALLVSEGGTLSLRAAKGLAESDLPRLAEPGSSAARAVEKAASAEGHEGGRAVLAVPLSHQGEVFGVLRAASRSAPRFGREEKRFLRALAARAASLLDSDRLHAAGEPEERLR